MQLCLINKIAHIGSALTTERHRPELGAIVHNSASKFKVYF